MHEDRHATKGSEGFWSTRTQPFAAPCGGYDRCGTRRSVHVLGGENLVEDGLGLVLVGLLCEGQFAHQNLAGFGQHALLTG